MSATPLRDLPAVWRKRASMYYSYSKEAEVLRELAAELEAALQAQAAEYQDMAHKCMFSNAPISGSVWMRAADLIRATQEQS